MAFEPITLAGRRVFRSHKCTSYTGACSAANGVARSPRFGPNMSCCNESLSANHAAGAANRRLHQQFLALEARVRRMEGELARVRLPSCWQFASTAAPCQWGYVSALERNTNRGIIGRQKSGEHLRNCPAQCRICSQRGSPQVLQLTHPLFPET